MKQPLVDPGSIGESEMEEYRSRMATAPGALETAGLATLTPGAMAGIIDHTLLKPEANRDQIRRLCREAAQYGFASVCVHPCWVTFCKDELAGSTVKVCTVIGFPFGASQSSVKEFETEQAIDAGAEEVDMVMSVGQLKSGDYDYVLADMAGSCPDGPQT